MAIYNGYYIKEISFESNTVRNIFTNFNSVFEPLNGIYVLVNGNWELISGEILIKIGNSWYNITNSLPLGEGEISLSLYSPLTESDYYAPLSETDYNNLLN